MKGGKLNYLFSNIILSDDINTESNFYQIKEIESWQRLQEKWLKKPA